MYSYSVVLYDKVQKNTDDQSISIKVSCNRISVLDFGGSSPAHDDKMRLLVKSEENEFVGVTDDKAWKHVDDIKSTTIKAKVFQMTVEIVSGIKIPVSEIFPLQMHE